MDKRERESLREAVLSRKTGAEFGFWDVLYRHGAGAELAHAYARAFWPDLIEVEGLIFLAENFDQEYFERVRCDYGAGKAEETINTIYLQDLFGTTDVEIEKGVWEELGAILGEAWLNRATVAFPGRRFKTTFAWYTDDGDPGITLFQESV
jgi:hypothetical protein